MARQSQKRRPTKAEKELQERCESLERRIQGLDALRAQELKLRQEDNTKQISRIEKLERELSDEQREHRNLRYSSQDEIDKLKRRNDEIQTALDRLRVRYEQVGDAFQAAVKGMIG